MRVNVKLFAILRDRAGVPELSLDLPAGATAASAGAAVGERYPALREHLNRVAYAVNPAYAPAGTALSEGDELALIPPVSGGTA